MTSLNSNVISIWRTSAIEVTALLKKILRSEKKGVQEKESIMDVGVDRNSVPSDHCLASLGE